MKPKKTSLKNKTRSASKSKLTLRKITKPAESKSKSKKHGKKILKDIENKKTTQKIKPKTKATGLKISSIKKGKTAVSGGATKKLPSKSKSPAKVAAKKSVSVQNKSAGKPKTKVISKIAAKPVLRVAPIKLSTKGAKTARKTSKTTTAIRERVSRNKKPVKALIPLLPSVSTLDISKLENDIVAELILLAKEQGYITYEDLEHNLPKGVENIYAHRGAIISKLRDVEIEIIDASQVDRIKEVREDCDEFKEIDVEQIDLIQGANLSALESANQIVLGEINANRLEGLTILGLLPIEVQTQSQIMDAVREVAVNQYRLDELLAGPHRAATVYAIAIARASGDGGESTWQAIENRLGVEVEVKNRLDFSRRFVACCKNLLLDDGEIGDHAHEAPILYQAGILQHWVAPLCTGIRNTLDEMPAANPDDEEYLARFCRRIGSRIPPGQLRLIDCLGDSNNEPTRLGILIIKKLLKSKLQGQEHQLPPHLRAPITDAMSAVSNKRQIYPPYLHFDAIDKILRIILPKQNPELLSQGSNWELNTRSFNPYRESQIIVENLHSESLSGSLNQLAGQLKPVPFSISTRIGGQTPIRIFNAKNGRDLKIRNSHNIVIQIPPGEYDLLADAALPVAGIPVCEPFKVGNSHLNWMRVAIRHNDPALQFTLGNIPYAIEVKQTPGLFLYGVNSVEDLSEPKKKKIYFGDGLSLMAVTTGVNFNNANSKISFSAEGSPQILSAPIVRIIDNGIEVMLLNDLDQRLHDFIDQLPGGLFNISVRLEIGTVTLPCKFWYWKGLCHVSETFGFSCSQAPSNIVRLDGLSFHQGGLEWDTQHHGIEVRIHFETPQETFIFRKPGIHLQVQEDANAEYIPLGETLLISHDDRRDLLIKSSGYEVLTIRTSGNVLTTLNSNKQDYAVPIYVAAGESRTITADRGDASMPLTLVTMIRPYEATKLNFSRALNPSPIYTAEFIVSKGVFSLGVAKADFMAQKFPIVEGIYEIVLSAESAPSETHQFDPGISIITSIQVDGSHHIKVEAVLDSLTENLILVDFYYRRRSGGNWAQLQYAEQVGTSPMRLVVVPNRYIFNAPNAWKHLVAHADRIGLAQSQALVQHLADIPDIELQFFLTILVDLMLYKYPTQVWVDAMERGGSSWPEQAISILGQARVQKDAIAHAAVYETTLRSSARYAPIISGSLYSAQPILYALPSQNFTASGQSFIERSFKFAGIASSSLTLTEFFYNHYEEVWKDYVESFANIANVNQDRKVSLKGFNFNSFFDNLKAGVRRNLGCVINPKQDSLLSPNHFTDAARKVNRRISAFQLVAQNHAGNHPLTQLLQSITVMHQSFETLQSGRRNFLGYPPGFFSEPQWDHVTGRGYQFPEVEARWGNKIVHIVILLTGMSRLTGYGLQPPNMLHQLLNSLLNPRQLAGGLEQGIRVIHSLAPEFFAFFHLFWSLTLKANLDNR